MLSDISYFPILGKPLIMYLGILTLLSFSATALVAILKKRGFRTISFRTHHRLAYTSLALGVIHGLLGLSGYF
jgi:hypothetical protein